MGTDSNAPGTFVTGGVIGAEPQAASKAATAAKAIGLTMLLIMIRI